MDDLFAETLALAPALRRAHLAAFEGPSAVRREVNSLLAAHEAEESELRLAEASLPADSLIGRRLGSWAVIREIGRGGMGAVYEGARQDSQFEKRVAIKTLHLGADGATLRQRFRLERQILAGLQHPNIAGLLDGGVTEDGLPYFILEFVDGKPIDAFCAERRLGLRARLDLFRQVAGAVQYAHRKLVIHRDLKPSNILVDADGVVKLVDFGIAKLLQADVPEVTLDARAPLTINYASPEQVKGEPITTASDVYSLGVVLYRLLAGKNPLELDSLSLDRAVNAICGDTPPPPSQAATEECAAGMQLGSVERLRRELRGELDAIVMMALRKEPDRRYPTVQALGDDLQRYLKGLPIAAAPDTVGYRVRKFVRRRRGLVLGLGVAAAALVIGTGIALWQAHDARHEARRALETSRFLQGVIGAAVSGLSRGVHLGPGASVAELLDSAASRVPLELDDPEVRSETHLALGRAYSSQERWDAAASQFDSARAVIERHFGAQRREVAQALAELVEVEVQRSGAGVDSMARRALAIYAALGAAGSSEYARVLRWLGVSKAFAGAWGPADSLLGEALRIEELVNPEPTVLKARILADLAAVEETRGNLRSAGAGFQRALAMFDSIPNSEVREKGEVLWYAARFESQRGTLARADSLSRAALRVFERATGPHSQLVAQQLVQLAEYARERGELASGRPYIERAMEIVRGRPEMLQATRERVLMEYARYRLADHDFPAADSLARQVYEARLASGNVPYIAEAGQLYGVVLREERRFPEAEAVLRDSYAKSVASLSATHPFSQLIAGSLILLYQAWRRPDRAEPYLAALPDSLQRYWRVRLAETPH